MRPTDTSLLGISSLAPGTYLLISNTEARTVVVQSSDGRAAAYIPGPVSDPHWDERRQVLAFSQPTNRIGLLEPPYTETSELDYTPLGTTPSWSPNGDVLVYTFLGENRLGLPQGLQVVYLATATTYPIPLPFMRVADPAWSPSGKRLAFATFEVMGFFGARLHAIDAGCLPHPEECESTLWALPLDENISDARSPSWSPDETRLAFQCTTDNPLAADICIYDILSGETTYLAKSPAHDVYPRWSPDGRWIAFTDMDNQAVRLQSPDASDSLVIPLAAHEFAAGWLVKHGK